MRRSTTVAWWRTGPAAVTLLVAAAILVGRWDAIWASHPAYLITLVTVIVASLAVGLSGVLETPSAVRRTERSRPRRRRWRAALRAGAVLGVAALLATLLYLRPLPASDAAVDAMAGAARVTVSDSRTRIVLRPAGVPRRTGLVFFPGALVDPRAYVPNLTPLAAAGYLVVVVKAPYNIALLDRRAVGEVMDANDDITSWAVGGHSLGGVAASSAAGGSDVRIAGLLLWASFPNGSIASREGLDVTSVSGSEDGLATPAKIEASAEDLPPDTEFVVVDGATHAHFGDYGTQSGDGTATISRADAQDQIRAASLTLLERIDLDR
jgi:hypothetical protein